VAVQARRVLAEEIGVVVIVAAAAILKFGSTATLATVSSLAAMGQAAMILSIANLAFTVLIPLFFLVAMLAVRRRIRDTIAIET